MNKKINKFLLNANLNGYAANGNNIKKEKDGSYSIFYEEEEFMFHDNWFGGEPFGGREAVFFQGKPYWMMVYYGSDSGKVEGLIPFLRQALSKPPEEMPIRGPKVLEQDLFVYNNNWQGGMENFSGREIIFFNKEKIYEASYIGGLVDHRKD